MPAYYFSPAYRGAPLKPSELGTEVFKSRKMEGTLGGLFNVLLAGERASGTVLYGMRKELGFKDIEWIEKAEPGEYGYRRISPSEAIGLKGYSDKFWTPRGIASLALDIVLDPTTYIGVGLVGKGVKLAGTAGRSIRVGERGAKFIAETQARGISRATAERKLMEYMGRSQKVQAEMMERTGPSAVKFMGRPIMATARVTEPAGRLWRAAPFLDSRTIIAESLRTKFQVFHRLKRQVGAHAVRPYEEYYRATGVGRTKLNREIARFSKDVPVGMHAPMVRYLELGEIPTRDQAEIISLAKRYQEMTRGMAEEEVAAGILKPSAILERYYARIPTEEAMRYTERKMGKEFGAGLTREETVSAYIRTLGAAHQRAIKGDIFAAEEYMTKMTGVKQWYEMDPFESLQRRGISSIMSLQSTRLLRTMESTMGIRAEAAVTTRRAPVSPAKRLASLIKGYRLTQQERAIESLRGLVAAGGDVETMRFADVLQKLEPRGVFGKVRPGGKTPRAWVKERFETPISEYHRYKKEIWEVEKQNIAFGYDIERELGRRTISRRDVEGFERALSMGERGIIHRREMLARITTGLRVEGGAIGRELIDPAERAILGYRGAYEASVSKIPAGRLITKTRELEKYMEKGGITYKLRGEYYLPTEALYEYTRRIPTTGAWSRLETKFKKTLTSIWPAFHARNLYGMALWQNVLAGVDPRAYAFNIDIMRKTSPFMAKHMPWAVGDVGKMYDIPFMGKKTAAQLRDIAEEAEVYGITGMIDVAATYTTKGGGISRKLGRAYEKYPQEMMVGVESIGRGALFWDRIMKGVPVPKAMKDVEKFHFRYGQGALTEFESDKMRHAFLFYRWMRGNVPLQAQMSLEKPYMFAGLGKIHERAHTPEARSRLKDWQKERFGFTVGNTFISLDLPFYEHPALFFNPSNLEDIYFALSPAIKFPVGITAGRDPATGAPIKTWGARGEYALSQFAGRGVYARRELAKTLSGERPVSWTAIHQLGGVGIYELSPELQYTGMTSMPRMPSGIKALGGTQETWTEYQMSRGWKPRLTDVSRAEIHQQHGGMCSICGTPCSPDHPCRSRLIVPYELGGTYTPNNTVLVCSECSGTYGRTISPLMQAQHEGLSVPSEYQPTYADRDKVFGIFDEYMNKASLVE